ncbi:MAG: hypothetical protein COA67_12535 [Lutibacter sp.]|nr:MAG: hypothetical protein COA67_12535 [Lutibacter sp.]
MKKSIYKIMILCIVVVTFTNCDDDNNTSTRSANKIEVSIDNGALISYSTNILAKDYPVAPTSGFSCLFKITSADASNNIFTLNLGQTVIACPFQLVTPTTATLTGPQVGALSIQGVDIDYSNAGNSITFNYQLFGANPGDDIKITFSGTYFDSLGNSHPISGDIDIDRS